LTFLYLSSLFIRCALCAAIGFAFSCQADCFVILEILDVSLGHTFRVLHWDLQCVSLGHRTCPWDTAMCLFVTAMRRWDMVMCQSDTLLYHRDTLPCHRGTLPCHRDTHCESQCDTLLNTLLCPRDTSKIYMPSRLLSHVKQIAISRQEDCFSRTADGYQCHISAIRSR